LLLDQITRADVGGFVGKLLETRSPSTASNRFRALQQFFKWCVEEELIETSPMDRLRPPIVPELPVPVLSDDNLRRLLKSCEVKAFVSRRDMAVIRLLIDTGMRIGECAGLALTDLDLDQDVAIVLGKGRRPRVCPFGGKTATALERYLRVREAHARGNSPALWLGEKGKTPMTHDATLRLEVAPDAVPVRRQRSG
jgi:site-specific recombinase XerD